MATADETLIGEGVVLETASATLGARTAGALLDAAVIFVFYLGTFVFGVSQLMGVLDWAAFFALTLVHAVAVFLGIPVLLETLTRGRSVGKWALGLRIVRDDGGPIGFMQALTRALVGFFELWATAGGFALIFSVMNKRGKRMGDMLAGTYSLQVRASKSQHTPLYVVPELTDWARSVDIRRLPDGLALAIRQFLTRAPKLHPASRTEIAASLATQLSAYVAPAPPTPVHPEVMMSAVLAVRREREYAIAMDNARADAAQAHQVQRLPLGVTDPP